MTLKPLALPPALENIPKQITMTNAKAQVPEPDPSASPLETKLASIWGERPVKLLDETGTQFYYRKGSMFGSPKASMTILLSKARDTTQNPNGPSAKQDMLTSLRESLIKEELNAKLVDLSASGVSFSVSLGVRSMSVGLSGFTE